MIKEFLQLHGEYHDDKSFKDLTTLKMGGPIAHFVMPESEEELKVIVNYLKNETLWGFLFHTQWKHFLPKSIVSTSESYKRSRLKDVKL